MKINEIIELIQHPSSIKSSDITCIDVLLAKYPYFQTGHLLLTKGLLNTNSIRYNRQLRKTASYCLDRRKLFSLITTQETSVKEAVTKQPEIKSIEAKLKINEPLKFKENDNRSFSEWLTLLNTKKIERPEEKIIDSFLTKNPKIQPQKKETFFNPINIARESLVTNDELVTPTLAKVYLEQGHYSKAISAYKKLILKYPKKNSFFASQIELINELKNK